MIEIDLTRPWSAAGGADARPRVRPPRVTSGSTGEGASVDYPLSWTQVGEDFSISIPNGAHVRARFSAAPETPLLLRGEPGAGSEVEFVLGQPLDAHAEGPLRLVVVRTPDSPHLAFWGNEPVSWMIKRGEA